MTITTPTRLFNITFPTLPSKFTNPPTTNSSSPRTTALACLILLLILFLSAAIILTLFFGGYFICDRYRNRNKRNKIRPRDGFPDPDPSDTEEGREARRKVWLEIKELDDVYLRKYLLWSAYAKYHVWNMKKDDDNYIQYMEYARAVNYTAGSIMREHEIRHQSSESGVYNH